MKEMPVMGLSGDCRCCCNRATTEILEPSSWKQSLAIRGATTPFSALVTYFPLSGNYFQDKLT